MLAAIGPPSETAPLQGLPGTKAHLSVERYSFNIALLDSIVGYLNDSLKTRVRLSGRIGRIEMTEIGRGDASHVAPFRPACPP